MHVMIATDGTLDASKTAVLASKLATDNGRVTVFTVVEVPRGLLDEMRAASGDAAAKRAKDLTVEYRTTQAEDGPPSHWAGDDAIVSQYVRNKVASRTSDLVSALDAAGVDYEVVGEEGESAARSVLAAAKSREVDVLCVGTHGHGRFEGLLGSLSTKMARLAPCTVVLVR